MALLVSIMDLKSTAALQHAADELHLTMCRPTNYVLKEAYGLVSLIPYDPLSKTRIGKALKAKSNDLFYAWVKYCVLNPSFSYSKVAAMYEEWCGWDNHAVGCYESVVMARAEAENKIMYDAVVAATVQSIVQPILLMDDSEADYSLAVLLHCIYRRKFVCTSLRSNTWYMYEGAKWQAADASCLRRHLSETIYQLFLDKIIQSMSLVPTIKSEQEYQKRQIQRVSNIMIALKNQKRKELIMRHATALFYDPSFDPELTPAK